MNQTIAWQATESTILDGEREHDGREPDADFEPDVDAEPDGPPLMV